MLTVEQEEKKEEKGKLNASIVVIGAMQSCHPRGQIIPFTQYNLGAISPPIPRRTWMTAKTQSVGHFMS